MLGGGGGGEGLRRTFMPSSPLTAGAQLSPTDIEGIDTMRRFAAAEEASAAAGSIVTEAPLPMQAVTSDAAPR